MTSPYSKTLKITVIQAGNVTEVYENVKPSVYRSNSGSTERSGDKTPFKMGVLRPFRRSVSSILRSKRMLRWLSTANAQLGKTYFFTATFGEGMKNYDQALIRWARFRRLLLAEYPEIAYLAVPEVQKRSTGNWHFHVLIAGLPFEDELRAKYGKMKNDDGKIVDAWMFHFTQLWTRANRGRRVYHANIKRITDLEGIYKYLSKYLTKEMGLALGSGRKQYYAGGLGLRRPKISHDPYSVPSGPPAFDCVYKDRSGHDNRFSRYIAPTPNV